MTFNNNAKSIKITYKRVKNQYFDAIMVLIFYFVGLQVLLTLALSIAFLVPSTLVFVTESVFSQLSITVVVPVI
jgi:hypothetical protein